MQLVDSHCHLNRLKGADDPAELAAIVSRAAAAGVSPLLCVAVDLDTIPTVLAISERFDNVYASVGVHPSEALEGSDAADVPEGSDTSDTPGGSGCCSDDDDASNASGGPNTPDVTVAQLTQLAAHPKVIAIGETGLDYYYNKTGHAAMRERFRRHIEAAHAVKKPLIIHTRDAREDTITLLREGNAQAVGGVMHCFTESWEMAEAAMALGFYISISGIVTFKNAANVAEVARRVPLSHLLIETDAPYLTPVPYRGKPNEPAYVRYVAEKIAELKHIPVATVAEQTTENFFKCFRLGTAAAL